MVFRSVKTMWGVSSKRVKEMRRLPKNLGSLQCAPMPVPRFGEANSSSQRTLEALQRILLPMPRFWGALALWCHDIMAFQWKSGTMMLCSASGTSLCEVYAGTSVTGAWRKVQRISRGKSDMMTRYHHGGKREERWEWWSGHVWWWGWTWEFLSKRDWIIVFRSGGITSASDIGVR